MPIRNARDLKWALGLLGVALAVQASAFVVMRWHDWRVLDMPVDLKPGTSRSPEFRVDLTTTYVVALKVDRSLPAEELDCLLGNPRRGASCRIRSVVDIEWVLLSGSTPIASGASRHERGGTRVTRTIGRFAGTPGAPYVLQVTTLTDGSALAPASPRILVEVHRGNRVQHIIVAQAITLVAIAIGLVGLYMLVVWVIWGFIMPQRAS